MPTYQKTCKVCGNEFTATHHKQEYCASPCASPRAATPADAPPAVPKPPASRIYVLDKEYYCPNEQCRSRMSPEPFPGRGSGAFWCDKRWPRGMARYRCHTCKVVREFQMPSIESRIVPQEEL